MNWHIPYDYDRDDYLADQADLQRKEEPSLLPLVLGSSCARPNPADRIEKTARPESHSCDQEPAGRSDADVRQPAVGEPQFTLAELCAIDRQRVERGRT